MKFINTYFMPNIQKIERADIEICAEFDKLLNLLRMDDGSIFQKAMVSFRVDIEFLKNSISKKVLSSCDKIQEIYTVIAEEEKALDGEIEECLAGGDLIAQEENNSNSEMQNRIEGRKRQSIHNINWVLDQFDELNSNFHKAQKDLLKTTRRLSKINDLDELDWTNLQKQTSNLIQQLNGKIVHIEVIIKNSEYSDNFIMNEMGILKKYLKNYKD